MSEQILHMATYKENNINVELLPFEKDIRLLVEEKVEQIKKQDCDDPCYIVDMGDIIMKHKAWIKDLPRVTTFYAVKSNSEFPLLRLLADMGLSFDCASKAEMDAVMNLGVPVDRIVYSNPCKQISMLKHAAAVGVSVMSFDNESELHKIKRIYPTARLLLRLLPVHKFISLPNLGTQFGCHPDRAETLLQLAKSLGLSVIGVSFHMGLIGNEPNIYAAVIKDAKHLFDLGRNLGFTMKLLDIGGGLSGKRSPLVPFTEFAEFINEALDEHFPAKEGVEIIAEPGTYFVQSAYTLLVNVISKRVVYRHNKEKDDVDAMMYYINDGRFGSFQCLSSYKVLFKVSTIKPVGNEETHECKIWGPTLDITDVVVESVRLPDLDIGQWLYFENMGAYTIACATQYNGMPLPQRSYYCLKKLWSDVYPSDEE